MVIKMFSSIMKIYHFNPTNLLIIYALFPMGIIFYFSCNLSYAYDAEFHESLSEKAIKYSDKYINSLILAGLIDNDTDDIDIEGKEPSYWFKRGSSSEDYIQIAMAADVDIDLLAAALGGWREFLLHFGSEATINLLLSHFYNPLTDKGYSIIVDGVVDQELYESLIERSISENNTWSYNMARAYYYAALTGKKDSILGLSLKTGTSPYWWTTDHIDGKGDRGFYFAITFQSLGHIMHLIQDASVPAHTRNDLHTSLSLRGIDLAEPEPFEKWTKNMKNIEILPVDLYATVTPWKNFGISGVVPAMFFDSGALTESTVDPIDSDLFPSLGLAEYSHANFVSNNSIYSYRLPAIPAKFHEFPDYSNADYKIEDITINGKPRKFVYLSQNQYGGVEHLARCGILHYINNIILPVSGELTREYYDVWYTTDDDHFVNPDYAKLLLPKAVSYSAGLLDYFFRGKIEISPVLPQNLTVRGDGSGSVSIFKIKASIRNATMDAELPLDEPAYPNEEMGAGTLLVVAKYMVGSETKYTVSNEIEVTNISGLTPTEFEFSFYNDPIPWSISKIDLQVIFKGTLGTEEHIAVAVGRRPLFDGIMEVSPPSEYVYSIIDASTFYIAGIAQPQFFTTLKASVKNLSAAKEIKEGTLTAIASYRRLKNYKPDMAGMTPLLSSEREDTVSSSISEPISIDSTNSVTSNGTREFTFDFRHAPIPAGITDLYLYIVFEGTLHDPAANTDQSDALVVGIKDLNEPQHLTYWNDTDYFLLNGYPRTAQWIRENDPHFVNFPDYPGYGYIDPHNVADSVSFLAAQPSGSMPELIRFDLEPGRYSRIIVLTEAPEKYYVTDTLTAPENPYVPAEGFVYEYEFARTINQLNSDGLWHTSPYLSARGAYQHDRTYYINFWPYFIFKDSVPVPANDLVPVRATNVQFP